MAMKANKGEWSEFYAFLKILEDKKLFAANKDLEIIPDKYFVFHRIFRNEKNQEPKTFDITGANIVILDTNNNTIKTVEDFNLPSKTLKIFEKIKQSSETTFEISEAQEVMDILLCKSIKADNNTKADIEAEIDDRIANHAAKLGFSVKSIVGGASTLLNAGKTTNFIFKISGLDNKYIEKINAIDSKSKVQDRIKAIIDNGGSLEFQNVARKEFEDNLRMIDTSLPKFISQMLIDFFLGTANKVPDLVEFLGKNEHFNKEYRLPTSSYAHKVKEFLHSTALGMVPSKVWDGFTKAHGGYIVVRSDGVVVCYNLYNRDEFLSYLYENTKFESASTSRHEYGSIYTHNGEMLFNLNLQIRFIR
jgi:hypothetical protein